MQPAVRSAASTSCASTNPGSEIDVLEAQLPTSVLHLVALRPVAEDHRTHVTARAPQRRDRRDERRHRASPGCAARRRRTHGLGRPWARLASSGPSYSPSSTVGSPRRPALDEPLACRREKQNARWGIRSAERLHGVSDPPADRPEILDPVVARPHLVPVDHAADSGPVPAARPGRQQREVRKGGGVDDVVAAPVAQQVPGDPKPEDERREDPASAGPRVQLHARADRDHANAGDVAVLAALPLAQRQVASPRDRQPPGARRGCRYQRSAPPTVYGNRQS